VDECVVMYRKPISKDDYWNDAQWDVNGICYKVSGFSAILSLRIGQLTLEIVTT
jgi:hypothetical protein